MERIRPYRSQTIFVLGALAVVLIYAACVLLPVYSTGIYRLSSTQILSRNWLYGTPLYGTLGIGELLLIGVVFLLLVPALGLNLLIILSSMRVGRLEQTLWLLAVDAGLIAFVLLSCPLANVFITYVLD